MILFSLRSGDGTFSSAPKTRTDAFTQVYTIFGMTNGCMLPLAFALLASKSESTYRHLFTVLADLVPNLQPRVFISDFEASLIPAIAEQFPNTVHHGCFFHLGQSLWRKVQDVGLQEAYKTDQDVRQFIKKLTALAFLPPADVTAAFYDLFALAPNDACKEIGFYWR